MKRACYFKNANDKFQVCRLRSVKSNGKIITNPISGFEDKEFSDLTELLLNVNLAGYGIVGSVEDITEDNMKKYLDKRNGDNLLNPDDL